MLELTWILSFLLLGSVVGFMAGLLGVGGGGIMVPVLTTLFLAQGMPADSVVHLALGTSMASIIITSLSSARVHQAKQGVIWEVVKKMGVGVLIGVFLTTFIVAQLNAVFLAVFFSIFMACVSVQMFLDKKPRSDRSYTGNKELYLVGNLIGAISAMVSIGGGSLTVPYLVWRNIDIKKAVGTSAAIGLPISLAGTAGYIINGWSSSSVDNLTLGFIYVPAVLLISATSVFTAPYGARLAHHLPVAVLKKIFSLLLIVLSIKMLSTVM